MKRMLAVLLLSSVMHVPVTVTGHAAGTITIEEVAPAELDPARAGKQIDSMLVFNVYDMLVTPGAGPTVEPSLATSWTISDDGLTYTFNLREDVKFHSGNPLTADDVVYSLNRFTTIGQGYSYLLQGRVASVEAVDKKTVRFVLTAPNAPFLSSLVRLQIIDSVSARKNQAEGRFGEFGDYSMAWLSKNGAGSGAYKVESHNPAESSVLVRNSDYFRGVPAEAPDVVRGRYGLDAATVRALVARGEIDIPSQWMSAEVKGALSRDPKIKLVTESGFSNLYMSMNTKRAPLDDVHCRKALAYAFPYNVLLQLVKVSDQVTAGRPLTGMIPEGVPGHDPSVKFPTTDMEKAKAEQAQCKYKGDALTIDMNWISAVPVEERFALAGQQAFSQLGYKTNIVRMPTALQVQSAAAVETTPHIMQFYLTSATPDFDAVYNSLFNSTGAGTWQGASWLQSKEVDAILAEARALTDNNARAAKYAELSARINELTPMLFGYQNVAVYAVNRRVEIPVLEQPGRMRLLSGGNFTFRDMIVKN